MAEEPQAPTSEGIDPFAASLALAGASREEADAFLRDQRHHMHEQLKQIHLDLWEKKLGVMLRLAVLCLGLAVIVGLAVAVWNATQADGLVVEVLSVPPRFAESGISGQVVADDLMNRITAVRDIGVANSLEESKGVSRDHDEDVKVEIPETGVSLGQAWHYLRLWLGHERRVTGNLRAPGDGSLALTVALEGEEAVTFSGKQNELGRLEQEAAEHVFGTLEPLNYSLYLLVNGRSAEALAVTGRAAEAASDPIVKSDAYSLLSFETRSTGDMALAAARERLALAANPRAAAAHVEVIRDSIVLGHDEEGLAAARAMEKLRAEDQPLLQRGFGFQAVLYEAARERDLETGDFAAAQSRNCVRCTLSAQTILKAEYIARAHDARTSRDLMEQARAAGTVSAEQVSRARYFQDAARGNWQAAVADARAYAAALRADTRLSSAVTPLVTQTLAMSLLAYALSESGNAAAAWSAIGATPVDCYDCIRTRGAIAAAAKEWGRSDYWFARAVQAAPSVPFAYADWGQSLLVRGKPDDAIAKFTTANQKGPHFADALEDWGEALMAKNQSHLALAKFAEANKYAPNWGRLHLKWGEALAFSGKPTEAKAQFARAAALDLTPPEKSELAQTRSRMNHG